MESNMDPFPKTDEKRTKDIKRWICECLALLKEEIDHYFADLHISFLLLPG
jgi:hypothetical protein